MKYKKNLISIITTAYNEEKNIERSISSWDKWLLYNKLSYEIIVYDDGSKDKTFKILKNLNKKYPNLHILHNKKNHGYGYGMRQALKKSKGNYIVTIDSDNQYFLSNIKIFLDKIKTNKNMFFTGHRLKKKDTFLKVFADLILRRIVKFIFNTQLIDTNCALKMFDASLLKKIKLKSKDYTFPTELCLKVESLGIKIIDLPIKHSHRTDGRSGINLIFTSIKFLLFLIKLKLELLLNEEK